MNEILDDEKLKSAVQRVWGAETAPSLLRARIQKMLTDAADSPAQTPRDAGARGYAIAAAILLSAGILTWMPWGGANGGEEALPQQVADSIMQTHDRCSHAPNHHIYGGDDFVAIGAKFAHDLKVPVISTALSHWQFAGAGPCPVWGHESAHLLYRNGSETLSVFSIPVADFSMSGRNADYSEISGNHELAAFVNSGGLYCVMESSPAGMLDPADARRLRDHLRSSFSTLAINDRTSPSIATLASSH